MQNFWKCVRRKFSIKITKRLRWSIPVLIADSEELVRRCRKKSIKKNGKIHHNAFYFGYHEISVDRSKYRSYKNTLQAVRNGDISDWCLIRGIVQNIKPIPGVKKIISDFLKNNPAHALIVCTKGEKERNRIAKELKEKFQKIPEEQYKLN